MLPLSAQITIENAVNRLDEQSLNFTITDLLEKKIDLVSGRSELPAPKGKTTVAVKIIDMLGEEVVSFG